ncbi:MAG: hypothetical protein PVI78_00215 [Anaerolineales bacterium]|jgi:REP element-mobilizing transposase RayT
MRLTSWDYTSPGWYFITISTKDRHPFFGEVIEDAVQYSPIGRIVEKEWKKLPLKRPHLRIDEWVIMPNHMHGILILERELHRASRWDAPTRARLKAGSLGAIINHFKSNCTKRIRAAGFSHFAWQRGFYDHIIRDDGDLERIRRYIRNNPLKWALDPYHPQG